MLNNPHSLSNCNWGRSDKIISRDLALKALHQMYVNPQHCHKNPGGTNDICLNKCVIMREKDSEFVTSWNKPRISPSYEQNWSSLRWSFQKLLFFFSPEFFLLTCLKAMFRLELSTCMVRSQLPRCFKYWQQLERRLETAKKDQASSALCMWYSKFRMANTCRDFLFKSLHWIINRKVMIYLKWQDREIDYHSVSTCTLCCLFSGNCFYLR